MAGTYVHLWRVLGEQGRADEMVRIAEDAAELCRAADMDVASRLLDCLAAGFLHQLGRWDEAEVHLSVDEAELSGLAAVVIPAVRGALAVDRGDLTRAREDLETARCLGAQVHDGRINGLLYRGLAELAAWEGRPDEALATVVTGLGLTGDDEMLARLCAVGLRAAADLAGRERRDAGRSTARPEAGDLVDRLVRLDARAEARHAPTSSEVRAAVATGEAEVTRSAGRSDPALWTEAARRWDGLGFSPPAAYCRWRLAEAVLAEGRRADALPIWRAAHEEATRLGAQRLRAALEDEAARAAIPLDQDGGDEHADAPAPFRLTARELEVLALVAAGRTNRQIGEALFISEKTASVHVSRILAKLGARSRAQAAALAVELGLAGGSAQASGSRPEKGSRPQKWARAAISRHLPTIGATGLTAHHETPEPTRHREIRRPMSVVAADLALSPVAMAPPALLPPALLPRVAAGDESAMRQLIHRFTPFVRSLARRLGTRASATDDVVQETMLRLWRAAGRFDPARGSEQTFVAAVTRNAAIDLARREACRPGLPTSDIGDLTAPVPTEADRVATRMTVRNALVRLPATERELLRLAYFEQLTQQEIAHRLQLPIGTVKSRTSHAFRSLRALLEDDEPAAA